MPQPDPKSILITGCSSGIGRSAAYFLRDRGFKVIATARQPKHVSNLQKQGFEALLLDLDDSVSIAAVGQYIVTKHPNLFGLVNNAAFGQPGAIEDLDRATLRAQFETNLFGTHELTQTLIPLLKRQPDSRIVQISSVLGFVALPLRGAYTASKFALEGLSDTLRLELQGTGVKISIIEPGAIDTQFRVNALSKLVSNIDTANSDYQDQYNAAKKRLSDAQPARFAASADRVAKDIHHALTAADPKVRYRITLPTILIAKLKRLLSSRMLDKFLGNNR